MKEQIYKDIDLSFTANPLTGDISKKTGNSAIKQSLRNILSYSVYEKPYNSEFDIGLKKLIFENKGSGFIQFIKSRIKLIVQTYEPRVIVNNVMVTANIDDNQLKVKLFYTPIETQSTDSLEIFLGRYND